MVPGSKGRKEDLCLRRQRTEVPQVLDHLCHQFICMLILYLIFTVLLSFGSFRHLRFSSFVLPVCLTRVNVLLSVSIVLRTSTSLASGVQRCVLHIFCVTQLSTGSSSNLRRTWTETDGRSPQMCFKVPVTPR